MGCDLRAPALHVDGLILKSSSMEPMHSSAELLAMARSSSLTSHIHITALLHPQRSRHQPDARGAAGHQQAAATAGGSGAARRPRTNSPGHAADAWIALTGCKPPSVVPPGASVAAARRVLQRAASGVAALIEDGGGCSPHSQALLALTGAARGFSTSAGRAALHYTLLGHCRPLLVWTANPASRELRHHGRAGPLARTHPLHRVLHPVILHAAGADARLCKVNETQRR